MSSWVFDNGADFPVRLLLGITINTQTPQPHGDAPRAYDDARVACAEIAADGDSQKLGNVFDTTLWTAASTGKHPQTGSV